MKLKVTVNDVPYVVEVEVADEEPQGVGMIGIGGTSTAAPVVTSAQSPSAEVGGGTEGSVRAPLAGTVSRIDVAEGDEVVSGQVLLVLEAMKMETELTAPKAGKVTVIRVEKGQAIQGGQPLLDIN